MMRTEIFRRRLQTEELVTRGVPRTLPPLYGTATVTGWAGEPAGGNLLYGLYQGFGIQDFRRDLGLLLQHAGLKTAKKKGLGVKTSFS